MSAYGQRLLLGRLGSVAANLCVRDYITTTRIIDDTAAVDPRPTVLPVTSTSTLELETFGKAAVAPSLPKI
jgi:hypothetical protein